MAKNPSPAPGQDQATAATDVVNAGPANATGAAVPENEGASQGATETASSSGDQDQGDASGLGGQLKLAKSEEGAKGAGLDDEHSRGTASGPDPLAIVRAFELLGDTVPAEGVSFNSTQRPDFEVGKVLVAIGPAMEVILHAAGVSARNLFAASISPHRVTIVTCDGRKHTVQRP